MDSSKMAEISRNKSSSDPLISVNEANSTREWQQLALWNATQRDYPRHACVPQLVATQAALRPGAVALVERDRMLTYRELNRRANQLAHYLRSLGVGPNVLVGFCVERSLEMVVGLLGILKAGGVYVPLDPSYPSERLSFMLEDARVPVLVTQRHLTERLSHQGASVVCLDTDADVLTRQPETDPVSELTATDLVYVIYTSGSTGRPKGVQIRHDSLLNLIFWHQRTFAVTPTDRATQITSPAFDATGWELWPYLTAGASIYLVNDEDRALAHKIRDGLIRNAITITFLPTALAEEVMTLEWPSKTALRYLLTGADVLHHYPSPALPFTLINNYGPTEATVLVTSGRVPLAEHPTSLPPIGHAIDNTQIYLLDEHLQPVPIGTAGELYIGGAGLSPGYLNRPELTAEKFIRNPFSDEPGSRLYKTGDMARFLPDGQIAFVGRADYQIKIKGYRIEPNEIASVLNSHPDVQASVVVAREDEPGEKRLVAYVVPAPTAHLTANTLRETLAQQLPDYMIPAIYVRLDALPTTPNGKVDRTALPAPDANNIVHDEVVAVPLTPTEERVVRIVSKLLKMDKDEIGIDDNFFLLGGHSLLGTQIIARVADNFGVDLSLRTLFEAPTIRQLSTEIERLVLIKVATMSDEEVLRLLEQGQNR
ncbi:MAG TPA: non-ribosomal peptide synthetase [Ktedonobacteraceae bacterium]|nr:non-ribosomal peptide synthetase [Ktedonobacteraceae bacterium]